MLVVSGLKPTAVEHSQKKPLKYLPLTLAPLITTLTVINCRYYGGLIHGDFTGIHIL
jgi:hypothetical protein